MNEPMLIPRRTIVVAGSTVALTLLPSLRASAQLAALSKLPWGSIFSALQVALASIPYLKNWLQGESSTSQTVICSLEYEDIENLEFRCWALALALDANNEGPVVPPEKGSRGIIPALSGLLLKQDRKTLDSVRNASLRMLDVSQNLLSEITNHVWLPVLQTAGLKPSDAELLTKRLKYAR
jgi:hypothetical protein